MAATSTIPDMPGHVNGIAQRENTSSDNQALLPGPEDVAVYLQILKLKEEVLAGRHARLKPSHPLAASSSGAPSPSLNGAAGTTTLVPGAPNTALQPAILTNGQHQTSQTFHFPHSFASNNQMLHPMNGSPVSSPGINRHSVGGPATPGSNLKPPSINPLLLQKAPELVDAELRFARLRIENELEEQVAREKREQAQSASKQDTLPDFDVHEVLSYAQEFEMSSLAKFAVPVSAQNTDSGAVHTGADSAARPNAVATTVDPSSKLRTSPSESGPSQVYSSQMSDEGLEEGEERSDPRIGTKPCKYFFQGRCFKKEDCKFSHDPAFAHQMSTADSLTGRADRSGAARSPPPANQDQSTGFRQRPSLNNIDTTAFTPSGVNAVPVAAPPAVQSPRVPPPREWQPSPGFPYTGFRDFFQAEKDARDLKAAQGITGFKQPVPTNQHAFPNGEIGFSAASSSSDFLIIAARANAQQIAYNPNSSLPNTPRSGGNSNPRKRPRASSPGYTDSTQVTSPKTYIKAEPSSPPPLSALNSQSNNVSSDDDSQTLRKTPRERLPAPAPLRASRSNETLQGGGRESPLVRQPLRRVVSDPRRPVESRREPDLRRVATTRYAARPATSSRRVVYVDELPRSQRAGSVVYVESRAPHRQAVYEVDDGMEEVQYEDDLVYAEPRVIRRSVKPSRTTDRVVIGKDGQRYIERIVDDEPDFQPAKVRRVETLVDSRGRVMSVMPASEGIARTVRAATGIPTEIASQEDRARLAMPPPASRSVRPAARNPYQAPASEQRVVVREQTEGLRRRHTSVVPRRIIYEHEVYDDDEDMGDEQGPPVEEVRYVRRVASVMPERRVRQRTVVIEEPYDRVSPEPAGYAYYADEGDAGYVVEGERELQ